MRHFVAAGVFAGLVSISAAGFGAGPEESVSDESAFEALKFLRIAVSAETHPALIRGVQRYATDYENQPLDARLRRAERAFDNDKAAAAIRNYKRLAYYGDKYAQFRIATILISGTGDQPVDPVEGIAWLALAAEHPEVRRKARKYADEVWEQLSDAQKQRAIERVGELAQTYSNFAVLERTIDHLNQRLRERTGTRLKFGHGPVLASSEGINVQRRMISEFRSVRRQIEAAGNVELGELIILEPDDETDRGPARSRGPERPEAGEQQ